MTSEVAGASRSRHCMNANDSALLVIDVQKKLLPLVQDHTRLAWNIGRLIDAAELLSVPVAGTEQYPRGLGATIEPIGKRLRGLAGVESLPEKLMFSCRGCDQLVQSWVDAGIEKLLLCGIETHVCVAQTALDLMANGFQVQVAVDAVGSRYTLDHQIALQRIESCGGTLTTTEAAMFEWCEVAGSETFKSISRLVQQSAPTP